MIERSQSTKHWAQAKVRPKRREVMARKQFNIHICQNLILTLTTKMLESAWKYWHIYDNCVNFLKLTTYMLEFDCNHRYIYERCYSSPNYTCQNIFLALNVYTYDVYVLYI